MYSEACSQNDLYFFPPLDRNDDDNYFVFNKYIQNPCISTIEENPIINEPQKNPRFDTNIEDVVQVCLMLAPGTSVRDDLSGKQFLPALVTGLVEIHAR